MKLYKLRIFTTNFIQNRAFTGTQIRELYLRHCGLTHIQPEAFDGLNNVLRILDLSGNNLTTLLINQFKNLDALRYYIITLK